MKTFNFNPMTSLQAAGPSSNLQISSPYQQARHLQKMEKKLAEIRSILGLKEKEFFMITSCQQESFMQVVQSHLQKKVIGDGFNHLIVASTESAATIRSLEHLKIFGCHIEVVEVSEGGFLSVERLKQKVHRRTSFLSVSWAHPVSGVIQPIREIAEFCKERGIILHVDCTAILGRELFEWKDLSIDYVSAQIGNIGILLAKEHVWISPWILGRELQGIKSGLLTLDVLEKIKRDLDETFQQIDHRSLEIARLRYLFEKKIEQEIGQSKALLTHVARLAHSSIITFPFISSEYLLFLLQRKNIYASIGGEGELRLDELLIQSGIKIDEAKNAIAFAFPDCMTEEMVDEVIQLIRVCYEEVKALITTFARGQHESNV